MANPRNRTLSLLATLSLATLMVLAPLARAEDPASAPDLAPPTTSDVSNEGVPPAAAPAPDAGGSLDSEPPAEKPVKKSKKKKSKKDAKSKKGKKKGSKKKSSSKKHAKKKHKKKYTD